MATDVRARPLGVRPEIPLTEGQRHALQALQDYDLSPIRERLLREGAMPSAWLDEAILEFRRYMGLSILVPGTHQMFSRQIDQVWHTCLLFSRLYADLCERVFGHFVHHDPETEPLADPQGAWREFVTAYESCYGELPRLWRMGRPA